MKKVCKPADDEWIDDDAMDRDQGNKKDQNKEEIWDDWEPEVTNVPVNISHPQFRINNAGNSQQTSRSSRGRYDSGRSTMNRDFPKNGNNASRDNGAGNARPSRNNENKKEDSWEWDNKDDGKQQSVRIY